MKRIVEDFLIKWKSEQRRKPLIIRGARQVGKTYSITNFGNTNFENIVKIDFEREPSIKEVFQIDLNPQRICMELEIVKNIKISEGKTLIFFDEIQECPQAIMALRYFFEEKPNLHIIATGSLLEFSLSEISIPVGRIQFYDMFPMNFSEFLLANKKEQLHEIIQKEPHQLSKTVHEILLKELKFYFFVGGMPEAVKTFYETGSVNNSFDVISEIVNSLKKAYQTLQTAKLIHQINAINPTGFPVQIISSRIFKTNMLDIGIMNFLCGISRSEEFLKTDLLAIYRGALAEQFVGQEFAVNQQNNLYYWERQAKNSTAEVDYVIQKNNKWFPIEVKSGSSGSLRSLHLYLTEFEDCTEGLVLSSQPYSILPEQKLKFIPLYFAGSISIMN